MAFYRTIFTAISIILFNFCTYSEKKANFQLCGKKVFLEEAKSDDEIQKGLMNRNSLKTNHGMIFYFSYPSDWRFWMKNVLIPLDAGFFDKKKRLIKWKKMEVETPMLRDEHLKMYSGGKNTQFVIEMNAGWFKKNTKKDCVFKKL